MVRGDARALIVGVAPTVLSVCCFYFIEREEKFWGLVPHFVFRELGLVLIHVLISENSALKTLLHEETHLLSVGGFIGEIILATFLLFV